ncbi:MarR family winged helix-turn-helix transcriptional regulator [Williamsia phyllosphaerae]|uniref:MarR family transcriptional regulator n=1 Tax=Williamsia phyllosphaerae TaxID=885042 RepID=A0ABQ1UHF4_9NOCA|nr:MarR family transcriptional regulator [Williamsia phyllosphaerae]GGF18938.1 MarR family transcriptional regulator [Williamsia phyllosphaerae]
MSVNGQPVGSVEGSSESDTSVADWLSATEQAAWRSFVDGSHELIGALDRALNADAGLSFEEYRILVILSENDTLRMSDLSRGGLASRSTVSRQVSRLVERGDVERLPDVNDARNRLVRISELGRERLHEAAKDHVRLVRRYMFDHLAPEQVVEMTRILTTVRNTIDEPDVR